MYNGLSPGQRFAWLAVLCIATLGGSLIFACATPFPALATLAALHLTRRDALLLTGILWAANQVIGYVVLNYPQTWDSFGWGAAIGVAAFVATITAIPVADKTSHYGFVWKVVAPLAVAFASYELVLYAATATLPAGESAFGAKVVLSILQVNVAALACLLALQYLGTRAGIASTRSVAG